MPIYEYACQQCQSRFEKLQSLHQQVRCPQCDSDQLKRLPSTFSSSSANAAMDMAPMGGCGRCGSDTPGQCRFN